MEVMIVLCMIGASCSKSTKRRRKVREKGGTKKTKEKRRKGENEKGKEWIGNEMNKMKRKERKDMEGKGKC